MRSLYLHRRFLGCLGGFVFLFLFAYAVPGLFPWAVVALCLFGMAVLADVLFLYALGGKVEAERQVSEKFSNGDDNPVTLWVKNGYPFRIRALVLDEVPVEFQRRDVRLLFRLDAGEQKEGKYVLRPLRRGLYGFGNVRVFVSSGLGLVERCYVYGLKQVVAVYPSFFWMRQYELLAIAGFRSGTGAQRQQQVNLSSSFDRIKAYALGDDPRAVNWKATAKCNHLMVNVYTEEKEQQVYCLLDKGRAMQAPFHGMTTLDYAINAILALSCVVLKKGDKAGLLAFSSKMDAFVKADNRQTQLNLINEMLYNQQTVFLEPDFEQVYVTASRRIPTRSLLVLFTNFDTVSSMRRRLPALLRLAKKHLLVVVLFENTEINRALGMTPRTMRDIYFKVMVGSFITEKRRIAAELHKAGICTVLTEPEQLSVSVINTYLELKGQGLF